MGELKASCCWEIYYMLQILMIYVRYISGAFAEYISAKQILRPNEKDNWHYMYLYIYATVFSVSSDSGR